MLTKIIKYCSVKNENIAHLTWLCDMIMIYYRKVKELIMSILTDKSKYKKRIIDKTIEDY